VWEEEEKECSVDGIMYDIAKIKIINGTKYLYCLSDEQETMLLANFVKSIDNKKETKQQKENKISLKLPTIYLEKIVAITIANFFNKIKNQFPALQQNSVAAIVSINIPPPKFS
jgi:hypothetical protein